MWEWSTYRPILFFEGNVNGETYLQMLNEEVFPQLVEMFGDQFENGTFQRLWWAQDGAPGHRAKMVARIFSTQISCFIP